MNIMKSAGYIACGLYLLFSPLPVYALRHRLMGRSRHKLRLMELPPHPLQLRWMRDIKTVEM